MAEGLSYACHTCGFELWTPVASSPRAVVGLYDDARFPGRCIVALREHVEHFDDVEDDLAAGLLRDARRVGRLLRRDAGAQRVNYAVLGNTEPHVHVHVIPRYSDDPVPTRPPWEHPGERLRLSIAERERFAALLAGVELRS